MHLLDRATIIHYHRHRLSQFGESAVEALGWREVGSQRRRFEVVAGVVDFTGAQVLDLGCGTGDLLPFLAARFSGLRYLGIEQVPEFVALAAERYRDWPDAAFAQADCFSAELPAADHVVACGALGYRSREPDFVERAVRRMLALARRSVVFNVLDAAHFPEHPLLVGRDVAALEAFCRGLAPQVELIQGYAEDDATFVLRLD